MILQSPSIFAFVEDIVTELAGGVSCMVLMPTEVEEQEFVDCIMTLSLARDLEVLEVWAPSVVGTIYLTPLNEAFFLAVEAANVVRGNSELRAVIA